MEMYILRQRYSRVATEGLFIMGETRIGYTLEDRHRVLKSIKDKVPRETCIPAGRYEVVLTPSNRFRNPDGTMKVLPLLLDVPFFEAVRLHGGNTVADTEGCPLLARNRISAKEQIYGNITDLVVTALKNNPGPHFISIIDCYPGGYHGA